eukprot:364743-Chlamydomonas_euryale.AAC.18
MLPPPSGLPMPFPFPRPSTAVARRSCHTWTNAYTMVYLKMTSDVTSAQRPSDTTSTTQRTDGCVLVSGAAMDASASQSDTPTSADLSAPRSLAPSPQKPTWWPRPRSVGSGGAATSATARAMALVPPPPPAAPGPLQSSPPH